MSKAKLNSSSCAKWSSLRLPSSFSTGWTKSAALNNCLTRNLAAFVDWTTGKCTFDSEAFQQLLAFCNSFPDDSSSDDGIAYSSAAATVDTMDDPVWESDATRILSGKQLMATTSFYSFEDYIYNIYPVKDKVTFVGYPSESGEPGNSFYIQCPMAISSVTKYPDAAWDFVCSIIKKMNTIDENNYYYGFPISQAAFDAEMTDIMTEQYQLDENGEQVDWDGDGEPDKAIRGSYETMENGETVYKDVYALTQEEMDQILGLGMGADDYLTKPFRIAELRARVNAHLRRERRERHTALTFDRIKIDLSEKELRVDNTPVALTKSEYLICEYLARNKGQVFSKEQIYEAVFSLEGDSDNSTISTHIKNIRSKLNKLDIQPIATVWGIGYKWE